MGMVRDEPLLWLIGITTTQIPSDGVVAASVATSFSRGAFMDVMCVRQDVEDFLRRLRPRVGIQPATCSIFSVSMELSCSVCS